MARNVSVNQIVNKSKLDQISKRHMRAALHAVRDDNASIKADLAMITGKLDADDGLDDSDYEASLVSPTNTGGLAR